ncbi:MAG: DUF2959 family protein [Verrucomicrobiales bacterium]
MPLVLVAALALTSCQTVYYGAMEKLGKHKRDLLADRVESARDAQNEAKEQFRDALDEFSKTLGFHGGDLQQKYDVLGNPNTTSASSAPRKSAAGSRSSRMSPGRSSKNGAKS